MERRKNVNIVDRQIPKGKTEVSLSAFAFLFSEMVRYFQTRASDITDLERRLSEAGYGVGQRMLELINFREKSTKRTTRVVGMLSFIRTTVWQVLFGKQADSLEESTVNEGEYMIVENQPLVNRYISTPKDLSGLNTAAFVAGIIQGILDGADLNAEKVTAYLVTTDNRTRTVIVIKFRAEVIEREKRTTS